ncbi:sulfurtransferase [Paenibacillus flagellatus]|uniref:Sulfurtransferase n=1 Tax=Paenibacillus flagellatus TaxID=2211139 RepID=A0A2V5K2E4_9BACL|nr:sulfurtransferase [Paenibacillus flagellatus]PYI53379.1 sulfurtransferase [Paenibacillus flagellatus]
MAASSNIVSVRELEARLEQGERIVLADVRFSPKEGGYGREAYERDHVPGAVFVDFKAVLTDPPREHGGRSPLPSPETLAERLGALGIDRSTPVVVYEDGNGPAAARLWWVLTYLGHDAASVLDGGYAAWTAAGLPVTAEKPSPERRTFDVALRPERLVGVEEARAASGGSSGAALVDSRDASQYRGLEAPYDPVAGHIPGAVNYFWKDALSADGTWKDAESLRAHFAGLDPSGEIIVYCGSGISATPNVLALEEAGFANVKLYAGSWSDWISYPDNPIATGDE